MTRAEAAQLPCRVVGTCVAVWRLGGEGAGSDSEGGQHKCGPFLTGCENYALISCAALRKVKQRGQLIRTIVCGWHS